MAKKVTITFKNPINEANIDHMEIWWKLTVGGTYVQLGSDIPFVPGVSDYSVEDTSVNVVDDAVLYYQARAYNDNGGEIQGIDYSLVEGNITISGGGTYILDIYTNAVGAYSLRQLKTGITSIVEVRRDNDDTVADFTADEITDGTLETWVGANNGFVSKWYDQSGNGNDAVQTVLLDQPLIVVAGSISLSNGKPAISYATAPKVLKAPRLLSSNTWSINAVYELTGLTDPQAILAQHSGGSDAYRTLFTSIALGGYNSHGLITDATSGKFLTNTTSVVSQQYSISNYAHDDDYFLKLNNGLYEEVLSNFPSSPLDTDFTIGNVGDNGVSYDFIGMVSEVIVWDTDKTSDRVEIEANINTEYSIY